MRQIGAFVFLPRLTSIHLIANVNIQFSLEGVGQDCLYLFFLLIIFAQLGVIVKRQM